MLADLLKAFGQLSDPATRRVLGRAFAITLACFFLLWGAAWLGLSWGGGLLLAKAQASGWSGFWLGVVEFFYDATAFSAVLLASFLLFPALVGIALSFLQDQVCDAVEARHYPDLKPAREQPIVEMLGDGLRLAGITVLLNLLALPLYLVLLFFPPFNFFVFYGLNGYLLGREYFELVSVRRFASGEGRALRKRHASRVFLAGVVVAVLLTFPVLNLVMPVVAIAFMLHVFERVRRPSRRRGAG